MTKIKNLSLLFLWYCFISSSAIAQSFYQVDIIGFQHHALEDTEEQFTPVNLIINNQKAIALNYANSTEEGLAYKMRPLQYSALKRESYILKQKPAYQILFHYSWLQPERNARTVKIPATKIAGLTIEGSFRIRKPSYYLFDSQLYLKSEGQKSAFLIQQKQRMKEDSLYYLDHPQMGLLVKIHSIKSEDTV